MDQDAWVVGLIALILGGGGIGAFLPFFRYKTDRASSIATGAESAVQSLTIALKASDNRVTHLEEENEKLRATIKQLRLDVDKAQQSVRELTTDLATTRRMMDRVLGDRHD